VTRGALARMNMILARLPGTANHPFFFFPSGNTLRRRIPRERREAAHLRLRSGQSAVLRYKNWSTGLTRGRSVSALRLGETARSKKKRRLCLTCCTIVRSMKEARAKPPAIWPTVCSFAVTPKPSSEEKGSPLRHTDGASFVAGQPVIGRVSRRVSSYSTGKRHGARKGVVYGRCEARFIK